MAERYRAVHATGRRQPLSDIGNRANTPPVSRATPKNAKTSAEPSSSLPHNESLVPNGSLTVRHNHLSSPGHKRIADMSNAVDRDNKRNSAISTTSTNASGQKRKTHIGDWQLGKTIGKGGCSRVRAVRHRYTRQYGAVKIIARATAESTRAQSLANLIETSKSSASLNGSGFRPIPYGLEREIAVMKLLEHENIVRLFDVWENRNELYLIMDYVDGGELFHYVEQRRGLPEDEAIIIFRQIISALLYCHRLHICHRDLKPENILLNHASLTVKLIDFGMAALQPEGRQLSTPCGSPHYAAPEVVSARPYDGKQADVWSCGVILYVMLTGTTPYNYSQDGDIRVLFRDIARAKYYMPPDLSMEAKDLIRRIFVADPARRITMDGVWEHPLIHKFDKEFELDGPDGSKEAAIGPVPKLEDWTLKRAQDVDRDILRNMRTLWHSEPEQSLIKKLLNKDINQEKIFYAALTKHRDEHLENYIGDPEGMGYSTSDYHHSHALINSDAPPLPVSLQKRSQSQYSIMNDEHLKQSHSFVEPPPSVSSYDPYRASRDPILDRGDYVNVIVHRNGSASTRKVSVGRSSRHANSLRVEMLKSGPRHHSAHSSSSLARSGVSRHSMRRASVSKHSLTSSVWPSSPPVIASMKPSEIHKRNVSFGHIRRTSTTSALTSQGTPATPQMPESMRDLRPSKQGRSLQVPTVSPTSKVEQVIRSRKAKAVLFETPRIKARNPTETPSHHMRSDIRKHSVELEKACQEAFFRDSVGSGLTGRTSPTSKGSPYQTPPSSVSRKSPVVDRVLPKQVVRPLPELPKDTPNTYLHRTLEEARNKLAAYKAGGDSNTAKFDEVMRMLDNIGTATPEKRTTSAPEPHLPDYIGGFLPMITEESDARSSREGLGNWRSVTSPTIPERRHNIHAEDRTVRIVQPSSPGTVAPLNVRKRSNGSQGSDDSKSCSQPRSLRQPLERKRSQNQEPALEPIDEDTVLPKQPTLRKKKSWFGLARWTPEPDVSLVRPVTPSSVLNEETSGMRISSNLPGKLQKSDKVLPKEPPHSALSSEFPIRKKRFGGGKKGFTKWLGRKGLNGGAEEGDTTGQHSPLIALVNPQLTEARSVSTTLGNNSLDSLFSTTSPSPSIAGPTTSGLERSWFARFLNIKPASDLLCFSIPRGRACQELVLLLKEWQRHGIRDLQYSREQNTMSARVDRHNALDIKAVTFRIEIFVVLEHGRKVGLSIARFVQVKGAASGFRKVLEVIDGVMRGRGWLVEDREKWKALCEVVGV